MDKTSVPAASARDASAVHEEKRKESRQAKAQLAATRCRCVAQQQQRDREFAQHKAQILSNLSSNACDLSPKGSVDVKCHAIMDVLNTHTDYITTSSCSGRIALFHSLPGCGGGADGEDTDCVSESSASRMKRGGAQALGWLVVKHGVLLPGEMLLVVRYLCGDPATPQDARLDEEKMAHWTALVAGHEQEEAYQGELEGVALTSSGTSAKTAGDAAVARGPPSAGTVTLKMEPFVMHVECRTMASAKELLSAAVSDGGYRNSGVVPPGKKIMCGIRCTTGLGMEVPLILQGVNYARGGPGQRGYVWALLELANEKMHANELKAKQLVKHVARRVATLSASAAPP